MQGRCEKWARLFSGPDTVEEFMSQEDLVGVAKFINVCLDKAYVPAAGPSHDRQASDQPDVAGRYVLDDGDDE